MDRVTEWQDTMNELDALPENHPDRPELVARAERLEREMRAIACKKALAHHREIKEECERYAEEEAIRNTIHEEDTP